MEMDLESTQKLFDPLLSVPTLNKSHFSENYKDEKEK